MTTDGRSGALTGVPWQADAPLPTDVSHLLILPADHELISRRRLLHDPTARISNACLSCDLCSAFCPESIRPHVQMQALARKQPLPSAGLSGCTGCGACSVVCPAGLLLFKMLLTGIWHGGLSDESVEDMANANLHVMRFLGLSLEDDVPDHSVLSRFRTRLTQA